MDRKAHAMVSKIINLNLTPLQARLLIFMLQNEGRLITREELIDRVWRNAEVCNNRAVDVSVGKLRRKITKLKFMIITVYGQGYRMIRAKQH